MFAFFNTHELKQGTHAAGRLHQVVVEGTGLEQRPYAAARGKQRPFQNRDIPKCSSLCASRTSSC